MIWLLNHSKVLHHVHEACGYSSARWCPALTQWDAVVVNQCRQPCGVALEFLLLFMMQCLKCTVAPFLPTTLRFAYPDAWCAEAKPGWLRDTSIQCRGAWTFSTKWRGNPKGCTHLRPHYTCMQYSYTHSCSPSLVYSWPDLKKNAWCKVNDLSS